MTPAPCLPRAATTLMAALACGLLATGAARAQISPLPELGLWETTTRMLVNGRDVMADMRKAREAMMKSVPADRRAQFEAMMKAQGGGSLGDETQRECLVAKNLKDWSDPKARMREMEQESKGCRFEPQGSGGSSFQFKGRCEDPEGFTGDVAGTFTMSGPRAWTAVYTGKGKMAVPPQMAGAASAKDGLLDMRVESAGKWLAANCGDVKPDE